MSTLSDKEIIKILLQEMQMNMSTRGAKGHGAAHPYRIKPIKPIYGYEEINDKETTNKKPVKISRAFKKEGTSEVD